MQYRQQSETVRQDTDVIYHLQDEGANSIDDFLHSAEETSVSFRPREAESSILNFQAVQQLKSVLLELSPQRDVD